MQNNDQNNQAQKETNNQPVELFDTHAHIQFENYPLDADQTWSEAVEAGVTRMLAVGCQLSDSRGAVEFAAKHDNVWAAVGFHPHEADDILANPVQLEQLEELLKDARKNKIVAVGEIGLDYFYENSSKNAQIELLEAQIKLAEKYNLPVVFHVRDAFSDFWAIFDKHNVKKALIHCFTGVESDVEQILERNLLVALNGIMTFTKSEEQLAAAKAIPLSNLVLETDAPYLTPKPFRGKICKPEHVKLTAEFLSELRGESFEDLARQTTVNAQRLFNVS